MKNCNVKWVYAALIDWSIILIAISLSYWSLFLLPISILIIGNRIHALSILGHDGAHQLVCRRNRFLNDLITNIMVFWPLGVDIQKYRKFHFAHHRHSGDPDKDPEMFLKQLPPLPIEPPITKKKLILHFLLDLIGAGSYWLIYFIYFVVRPKLWALPLMFPIVTLALGYSLASVLWLVSLFTVFTAVFRLRVYSEHVGCPEGEAYILNPSWWQKLLYLPHNTWCHAKHHNNPSIAFSDLPGEINGKVFL